MGLMDKTPDKPLIERIMESDMLRGLSSDDEDIKRWTSALAAYAETMADSVNDEQTLLMVTMTVGAAITYVKAHRKYLQDHGLAPDGKKAN